MKSTVVTSEAHAPRGFRDLLRDELARRCADNAQYSLRAFARDLETDHSSLSQILRGRRRLSERSLRAFGARLGMDGPTLDGFVALESRCATPIAAEADEATLRSVRELTEDALAVVASPEHHAILELTHLDSFRPDVNWIARVLGMQPDEVNIALHRLIRLGMLTMESTDRWRDLTGHQTLVVSQVAQQTLRHLSDQVRRRTNGAESDPTAGREYSATTLAVETSRVPEALQLIARFRRELIEHLGRGDTRDGVYHLEISFGPLTRSPDAPTGDHPQEEI